MIKKIAAQFEIQTGRAPTDQELLEQLEKCDMVSAKRAKRLLETVYYSPTVQNGVLTSLDSYDKDDNDAQDLYAIVQDKKAIDPVEHAIKEDQKYLLDQMISTLSRREQLIIRSLYGLDGGPPKTLQVVGDEIGLTRERIRQIRNKVIQKLQRRCTRDHRLKTFKNLF